MMLIYDVYSNSVIDVKLLEFKLSEMSISITLEENSRKWISDWMHWQQNSDSLYHTIKRYIHINKNNYLLYGCFIGDIHYNFDGTIFALLKFDSWKYDSKEENYTSYYREYSINKLLN